MRIYIAPHVSAYTVESSKLDTVLALSPGIFNTVVQAWDNCGAVGKTSVNITVAAPGLRPARFLYVADDSRNRVWGFTVDPSTGALDPTGQGPIATNSSYRLASDKGGNRLYVTNAGPVPFARVYAYFVDRRNGSLHPVPDSPFSLGKTPGPIAVHPSGQFIFVGTVTLQPDEGILVFKVNTDGSLTPANSTPAPTTSTPNSIVVDRWGRYLYVTSSGGNSIDAFEIDAISGALTPVSGSPYTVFAPGCPDSSPSGIAESFGRFLYSSDEGGSAISGYAIDGKTGTLTELSKSPFPVSGGCSKGKGFPRALATEPTGRFLYVMTNGNYFSIYSINAGNGFLRHVKDTPRISNGLLYGAVETDPSGKFLYVRISSNSGGDEIAGFSIDPISGDLTALPGSPFPIGPNVHAFDLVVIP